MTDQDALRQRELAAFLRTRRERLSPEEAGLPRGARRRTPGLRREEVALLAGVGVTWYTWLEQGRPISVSTQVIAAIARTLRLDGTERAHLFTLAGAHDPRSPQNFDRVSAPILKMLDALSPYPAFVITERWDVLAWNAAAAAVLVDFGALPEARRNILKLTFACDGRRAKMVDWHDDAALQVAMFRAAMASHSGEPAWQQLLDELIALSPEFTVMWQRHEVARPYTKVKRYMIPDAGLLELETTSLWLAEGPGARLVSFVPANDESALLLRRLVSSEMHGLAGAPAEDGLEHAWAIAAAAQRPASSLLTAASRSR